MREEDVNWIRTWCGAEPSTSSSSLILLLFLYFSWFSYFIYYFTKIILKSNIVLWSLRAPRVLKRRQKWGIYLISFLFSHILTSSTNNWSLSLRALHVDLQFPLFKYIIIYYFFIKIKHWSLISSGSSRLTPPASFKIIYFIFYVFLGSYLFLFFFPMLL